ncbi:hypothetical protein ACNHYB_04145 [Isoptericola jiangsuensis]|uniref:hypothetical protein n=1 Tax=Isoptericola jiangsuensis TaxID=548579 RepID=UPI003AAD8999
MPAGQSGAAPLGAPGAAACPAGGQRGQVVRRDQVGGDVGGGDGGELGSFATLGDDEDDDQDDQDRQPLEDAPDDGVGLQQR